MHWLVYCIGDSLTQFAYTAVQSLNEMYLQFRRIWNGLESMFYKVFIFLKKHLWLILTSIDSSSKLFAYY